MKTMKKIYGDHENNGGNRQTGKEILKECAIMVADHVLRCAIEELLTYLDNKRGGDRWDSGQSIQADGYADN